MLLSADYTLPTALARTIEDAVLFGHVKELDIVLNILEIDTDFPEELRYGLEALRYFRSHYGRGGLEEPQDFKKKQKMAHIESTYAAELLEKLKRVDGYDALTLADAM